MKQSKLRKSFSNRKFKMGSFQTLMMLIVLVVVVVVNVIVARLDLSVDMNSDFLYSLSDDTVAFANKLEEDITIYYLVEDGNEAVSGTNTKIINVENIINLYGAFSRITVEKKNPVLYPNFAKDYTDKEIKDNDVIVVNNDTKKSQYVSFQEEMIEYGYDTSSGSYEQVPQKLKLESAVTSAIQKVTLKNTKKVYVTNDHGEQALSEDFYDLLSKSGLEHEQFALEKNSKIADDCDLLIMHGPSKDLNNNEYKYVYDYLKEGGKAMFFLNYTAKTPNYNKLIKNYGINVKEGMVLDSEEYFASYGSGMYMLLTPKASENSNTISADIGDLSTLAWYSCGMTADKKVRGTLTTESVLESSDTSYIKSTDEIKKNNVEKSDKDESGPFSVAMTALDTHAENTKGEGNATKLFVVGSIAFTNVPDYSSNSMVSIISGNQYGNRSVIANALTWLVGDSSEEIAVLNIPDRSLLVDSVTLRDGDIKFWTAALLVVIPLTLLVVGFLIWNRRRKK